jgi:hypothetical protein
MAEWSIARDSPGKSAGRNAMGRAATAASLILRFDGPSELIELRKERAELQPLAGPRPFAPKGGTPPPFASSPGRLQDRPPLPSPLADLVNTLGGQILTLNGFVNRYSQVKWIFSTKLAQHKALILLKLILTPKWLPTVGQPTP